MPLQHAKLAPKYISEMEAVRNILSFNEAASAAQLLMKVHALHGNQVSSAGKTDLQQTYWANADLAELGMLCAAF